MQAFRLDLEKTAMEVLQSWVESYFVEVFENANLAVILAGRVTLMPKDLKLVLKIKMRE